MMRIHLWVRRQSYTSHNWDLPGSVLRSSIYWKPRQRETQVANVRGVYLYLTPNTEDSTSAVSKEVGS